MNSSCGADICSFSAFRGSSSSEYEAGLAVKSSFSFSPMLGELSGPVFDGFLVVLFQMRLHAILGSQTTRTVDLAYKRAVKGQPRRLGPGHGTCMADVSRIDRKCCRDCACRFCLGLLFLHKMFAISIRELLSEHGCQGMASDSGNFAFGR